MSDLEEQIIPIYARTSSSRAKLIGEIDTLSIENPILVTGAAGGVGSVGRMVVRLLRNQGLPVRAMVHRQDERAASLRAEGAEIVTGDLTLPARSVSVPINAGIICHRVSRFGLNQARVVTWSDGLANPWSARQWGLNESTIVPT